MTFPACFPRRAEKLNKLGKKFFSQRGTFSNGDLLWCTKFGFLFWKTSILIRRKINTGSIIGISGLSLLTCQDQTGKKSRWWILYNSKFGNQHSDGYYQNDGFEDVDFSIPWYKYTIFWIFWPFKILLQEIKAIIWFWNITVQLQRWLFRVPTGSFWRIMRLNIHKTQYYWHFFAFSFHQYLNKKKRKVWYFFVPVDSCQIRSWWVKYESRKRDKILRI